ncbi:MAG TPA: D-alanyl-D-alanine carboxypeptidase/D-alanyl-D-alanine-endopeptidase [Acidimicrobiales bacterium]|nr:D-alanyl-D-alanine carboxypeptidase/D-alanyl-D-alanine-endopeptidase [Acidimicrobiales bacterium]
MTAGPPGPARHAARPPSPPRPGRSGLRRALVPVVLAVVAVGAASGAVVLAPGPASTALGVEQVATTPVLSARRVPEVVAAPVAERRLAADLDAWLAGSPDRTCLVVASGGRDLFRHNPTVPVTGASTHKLMTATALLLAYGPDHTFTTTAVAAAPPRDGVVEGDLYVVGGGPADLGTPDWPAMAPGTRPRVVHDVGGLVDAIAAAGVTRVAGSVVGDGTRFDDQRYEPTTARRLIDQDQVGPIGGLMVNDGFARFGPERSNAGTVPAVDPPADAARVVTERLAARGVAVAGPPRSGPAPAGATTVATLDSPPLSQLVREMLTTSDNEAAEAAIKEVGVATGGGGSWPAGAAGTMSLLDRAGVPLAGVRVVGGSGLSIEERFTCTTLVDVLRLEGTGPVLRAGLPVAGETGTLAERFRGTDLAGRLRAKSGTLRNVAALAGEVDTRQGGDLTFAYVANVPDPGEVTASEVGMDRMGEILRGYPRGIDLASLAPVTAPEAGAGRPAGAGGAAGSGPPAPGTGGGAGGVPP